MNKCLNRPLDRGTFLIPVLVNLLEDIFVRFQVQLPVSRVQAFYGICGIENLPYLHRKLENRGYHVLVVLPAFPRIRVFWRPFRRHLSQRLPCFLLIWGMVNGKWFSNPQQMPSCPYPQRISGYCVPCVRCTFAALFSEMRL